MLNKVVGWLKSLLGHFVSFIAGFFTGKLHEKKEQAEDERDAAKGRMEVQDDLSKLSRAERKRMLAQWMRPVETDTSEPE